MFQARHYEAIARIIRETPLKGVDALLFRVALVDNLCRLFAGDNPHFRVGQFKDAAYGEGKYYDR